LDEVSFGDWLKHQRRGRGLTQKQLAHQIGCATITLRKIESGERFPSVQNVKKVAEIFNISLEEQKVFLRFARGDWRSVPAQIKEDAPWQVSTNYPRSNLPASTSSLVGREQPIADIQNYLSGEDIRLVTLVGPPGIGKTRLSIEAARTELSNFPDGVFFVALAPVEDPSLIALTIVQALGYVEAKGVPTRQQLMDGIGGKQMLILLDNCEHLIEDIASLASDLLSVCSQLKLLATSREALRVPGEWLYPVPVLDVPNESSSVHVSSALKFPALMLFAERARAVRPDFVLNAENVRVVSSICAQVDGLPLAIELMAARIRFMSPQSLLDRLSGQFILTADGMRSPTERQKTLNDAIRWSYGLLSAEEQKLFAYLSVFSGGFTLQDAESIFSQVFTGTPMPNLVISLLDKSLLQCVFKSESPQAGRNSRETFLQDNPTYNMLVTIHEFARKRLETFGGEIEIRNQHLAYFLEIAEIAARELRGSDQAAALHRLASMRENLRSALDYAIETGQAKSALQMVRALNWGWHIRGDHTEARQWLERVLLMPKTPSYPELQAELLADLALHTFLQIGPLDSKPYSEQALAIARAHKDKHNVAWALVTLNLALTGENKFSEARSGLEESKTLFREVHDEWGYARAVYTLGWSEYYQEKWSIAIPVMKEALDIYGQFGDRFLMSVILSMIGMAHVKQGNLAEGIAAVQKALALAQELDSKYEIASDLWFLGEAAQHEKEWTRAVKLSSAAKRFHNSIGFWHPEDDPRFENRLMSCRVALSESEISDAVEQGHAMTLEQAIDYALETIYS
jgi:predicted ATPase/transcriptional regulator with XRE-family HTH domain